MAAVYNSKFGDTVEGARAAHFQQLVLEELRVSASYRKAYKAKVLSTTRLRGFDDASYTKLHEYLYLLKASNPDSIADLETETDEDGNVRFKYLFLSFSASIIGFRRLRHVIVVDGTHLSGKFRGCLLTAARQDANFQVFPLAYAVVDSENEASWTWFFRKIEIFLLDGKYLTIISDRYLSIYAAKKQIYPNAHHGACIVHLARNVVEKFKSKGLGKLVTDSRMKWCVGKFHQLYETIRTTNPQCGQYLEKIGLAHWSNAYFQGQRYNLMTSNACEQLNKALKKGRSSPIVELL
ncbi:uncharacterized protein LOC112083005 [Eutrema salsugineum]|uniref:uncharacterized protein LOC112083005 n=1 Tax=Eutrema salsugineum TaxID=72664 RepID=UPI000CED70BA|nr:uncharacterized protein LOC112083005 [Eutrema salsugineum]